jgi:hypothetical protein
VCDVCGWVLVPGASFLNHWTLSSYIPRVERPLSFSKPHAIKVLYHFFMRDAAFYCTIDASSVFEIPLSSSLPIGAYSYL